MKLKKLLSCASDGIDVLISYHFVNRIFQPSNKPHKPQTHKEKRESCNKSYYYIKPIMVGQLQQKKAF